MALANVLRAVALRVADVLPPHAAQEMSWEAFREQAEDVVFRAVDGVESDGGLAPGVSRDLVIRCAMGEAVGYGCLDEILADDTVTDILVNDPIHIYVDRGQGLERAPVAFSDDLAIYNVACRLVAEAGVTLDGSHPMVDVRRPDGMRVRALIPPVSVRGTVVAIKKPPRHFFGLDDLVAQGVLSGSMADFLEACVSGGKSIIVAGGPGSGRTTFIGALASAAPSGDQGRSPW